MVDQRVRGGRRRAVSVPLLGLLVSAALGWVTPALGSPAASAGARTDIELTAETGAPTLAEAVAQIDAQSGAPQTEYGVAVLDRTTGRLILGTEGEIAFFSASVVKLFTVVDILHRVDAGQATLTTAQRTQVQRALRLSDNDAMTALWNAFGGPRTVTEIVQLAGLSDTKPPTRSVEWGETTLSPRDVTAVYRYALSSLSQQSRELVLSSLATAGTTSADGFDQSYGVLRQPALPGAAGKQGWMIDGDSLYLHTSGVVGAGQRYVIVVLTKQPPSVGYPAARQRLDSAVGELAEALGLVNAPGAPSGPAGPTGPSSPRNAGSPL